MANNPSDAPADDFLEQILGLPTFASADSGLAGTATPPPMMLQLNSGDASDHLTSVGGAGGGRGAAVAVLHDPRTRAGGHQRGHRGDVHGAEAVAAGADDVTLYLLLVIITTTVVGLYLVLAGERDREGAYQPTVVLALGLPPLSNDGFEAV